MSGYIELHAHSAYSFAVRACSPREMVRGAKKLGLSGLALLDYDGVYGLMEARAPLICPAKTVLPAGTAGARPQPKRPNRQGSAASQRRSPSPASRQDRAVKSASPHQIPRFPLNQRRQGKPAYVL